MSTYYFYRIWNGMDPDEWLGFWGQA
jgi:hypothetical protein